MKANLENVPQEKKLFPQGVSSLQGKSILHGKRQVKDMFLHSSLCFQKVDQFLQGT